MRISATIMYALKHDGETNTKFQSETKISENVSRQIGTHGPGDKCYVL